MLVGGIFYNFNVLACIGTLKPSHLIVSYILIHFLMFSEKTMRVWTLKKQTPNTTVGLSRDITLL